LKAIVTYSATDPGAAHHPVWSPDDLQVAFSDTNQIKQTSPVVGATATDVTTAQHADIDLWPSWAPGTAAAPGATLSFDGRLRDRVGESDAGIFSDGDPDGTYTLTLPTATSSKSFKSIVMTGPNGNEWD